MSENHDKQGTQGPGQFALFGALPPPQHEPNTVLARSNMASALHATFSPGAAQDPSQVRAEPPSR